MVYVDSSVFVSLYTADAHVRVAKRIMAEHPSVFLTPLHEAELTHALYQHVFRKELTSRQADALYSQYEKDRESNIWVRANIPESSFELATSLARTHARKLGVRTLDTLHVACALLLKADRFHTLDKRQLALAKAEGLSN